MMRAAAMEKLSGAAVALGLLASALFRPPPRHVARAERLAALPLRSAPLRAPVTIHWDDRQIPFIEAAHDEDLAAALGVVHAHLRLAQMEAMRRIAQGRVAEMIGPLGLELDRTLRLLDFGRAVPGIIAALDARTRAWAEHFLHGVNHVLHHAPLPHGCRLLGIGRESWTLPDLFTAARLAAADVTWMVLSRLLRARARISPEAWRALWPHLLAGGAENDWPGLSPEEAVLTRTGRQASNALAVAPARSASGAALLASDPHLPLMLPNVCLIAGMHSPGYHAVGLMLAGFPVVAIGRNPWLAWGGTSLHAAASDLFDVSGLPLTERTARVRVRWAGARTLRLRESPLGPVVSETALFRSDRPLALRWVGHAVSDEMGALLEACRAQDGAQFRQALTRFAVPGQTMVYADGKGRVGRVISAWVPRRPPAMPADLVLRPDQAWGLDEFAAAPDLPGVEDPPDGIIASANERVEGGKVPVGWFFSAGYRIRRLRQLAAGAQRLTAADLLRFQQDVMQTGALGLRDFILHLAAAEGVASPALPALAGWNGAYTSDSTGALAFECVFGALTRAIVPAAERRALETVWPTRPLAARQIMEADRARLAAALPAALRRAENMLCRHRNWGGIHRIRLGHHFAALPLIGRRYRLGEFPAEGGRDTVNKSGTGPSDRPQRVTFGVCARFVCDLADPDANEFVLCGGQDGWVGSENFADQVPLWRAGATITVPLRLETVRARFPHRTVLTP